MSDKQHPPRIVDVHQPEYEDPKEPYAFFGLAAYWAQCFEQSLILLMVAFHAVNRSITTEFSFDELFEHLDQQTLGRLIKELRRTMAVDENLSDTLAILIKKRNYLMHHFFSENSAKWFAEHTRRAMINELRDLAQAFQDGDRMIEALYEPLWAKLGVTSERVEREIERMKAELDA